MVRRPKMATPVATSVRSAPPAATSVGSSADPLRQLDDDPLRAADVAEPIDVLVALHLADELRAARLQPGEDVIEVVDRKRDMPGVLAGACGVLAGACGSPPWPDGA
jgi:hypothetical protein